MTSQESKNNILGKLLFRDKSGASSSQNRNQPDAKSMIDVGRHDGREKVSANDLDNSREGKWE